MLSPDLFFFEKYNCAVYEHTSWQSEIFREHCCDWSTVNAEGGAVAAPACNFVADAMHGYTFLHCQKPFKFNDL
jgi:hypothetical protein